MIGARMQTAIERAGLRPGALLNRALAGVVIGLVVVLIDRMIGNGS